MEQIKLEGFVVYDTSIYDTLYILPFYSYTCPCRIKLYFVRFFSCDTQMVFLPKFFKKFKQLSKEDLITQRALLNKIPRADLRNEFKNKCVSHPIETNLYYPNFGSYNYNFPDTLEQNMNMLTKSLSESDNFEIGPWIGNFAYKYWAVCNYNWTPQNCNATIDEKKIYITKAIETRILTKINLDEQKLSAEINKCFISTNMISPLINIIIEYNCPPLHTIGKLIAKFKTDIEKYS
ncbi:MAG: hypothetical protein Harvfovirus30_5 [Harvfovirus sp.]|uniref:Uncharacterized protein n=1 Tax=Harvfovirus sp. TaxID=2487768 RepID=A0A3G5A6C2_9VIRU|nr:MAG: hypothetical protein Harvfovirus30_5 [Harvfovirus sp.]